MRKPFLILGVVLVFSGLVVASYAALPTLKKIASELNTPQTWEISGDFKRGDSIYLVIVTGLNWSWWAEDPGLDPLTGDPVPLALNVTIVAPYNTESRFKVFYEAPPEGYEYEQRPGQQGVPILLSKVELVNRGSLEVTEPPDGIGGTVTQDGRYVARVIREWWMYGPAEYLTLHRYVYEKEYPNTFLIPAGGVLSLFGIAVSVWGAKTSKRKVRARPKRRR